MTDCVKYLGIGKNLDNPFFNLSPFDESRYYPIKIFSPTPEAVYSYLLGDNQPNSRVSSRLQKDCGRARDGSYNIVLPWYISKAILEDAQNQQETRQAVKQWLLKLEDVAYASEDLLDEISDEIFKCERRGSRGKDVSDFFLPFKPSDHLFHIASKLQNKLKDLNEIAKQGFTYNLRVEKGSTSLVRSKETWSSVVESKIYGREDDKKNLLKLLLPGNEGKTIEYMSVVSIVGIGGLGKTTLAQLVYNDKTVNDHFDLKMWIYVSESFDIKKLMMSIVESATKGSCRLCSMDLLQSQLQDSICGKRFLLVLDDVWNEDKDEWERFIDLLRSGAEGSRVVVTTRSMKVAYFTGSTVYELKVLSDDACWVLFRKQAFGEDREDESTNLMKIGKEIIKKCGGVPLAAKTLGSLLRLKKEDYWMSVQDSELWNLKGCQGAILPALRLSYVYLPPHLKRCFAFCSLFPKNHEINKEKMIYIWMAEGLILPDGENRQLESIGDEYFDDLLHLSFFQEVEKCKNVSHAVYKMHDLIHDLARTIGGNVFAIFGHGLAPSDLARIRHSSVICNFDPSSFPRDLFEAKHLRTLLFLFPGGSSGDIPYFLIMKFIYLRILDLNGSGIKTLHESVSALLCLRFLDLSSTSIQTLPTTISDLSNLQTLNLSGCCYLVELPFGMANVTSLRHLNIMGCEGLTQMPAGIGNLIHLQTLPIYIVGKRTWESIAELHSLNLRGELHIKRMENIRDAKEAREANMREKKHLHTLRLQWGISKKSKDLSPTKVTSSDSSSSSLPEESSKDVEDILECLEPHANLKNLHIKGYPGIAIPPWDLPNLVTIELINCRNCVYLPKIGQLPFLERISLQGMDGITSIDEGFYGGVFPEPFPCVKFFTIKDFPNLEDWSSIDGGLPFPRLEKLILDKCPNLTNAPAPAFPSIRHLELHFCNAKIMESLENITSLSSLVVDMLPNLNHISGSLLGNNKYLESLEIRACQNLHLLTSKLENLIYLRSLIISCCEKLSDLPPGLKKLERLELLEINCCHSLILLPHEEIEGLGSLKTFSIENCSNLISLSSGFHHLSSLEQLSIMSCPKLTSLPDGFENLSTLRSLNIVSCPELSYLPSSLQHATTLQSLVLHSCPGLITLPEWFKELSSLRSLAISNCNYLISLPEAIQSLTTLQHLSIQDCPQLERLCKKMKGKEWQKIKHVPHMYIGSLKFCKGILCLDD
ncbi:putative disease resistance protein RGA3 [Olea europaea var. sylvestris]|uniref:putative disease resistance protein RGA3 n=1 Tax=Olea europaea var. sylvestris TaxID=158386 RepID=UPI000C1CCE77|nr:putative disease resistance protein RGA3 [Olea europaea var. sylvestris]